LLLFVLILGVHHIQIVGIKLTKYITIAAKFFSNLIQKRGVLSDISAGFTTNLWGLPTGTPLRILLPDLIVVI
jgi:hypothetical protein